MSQPATYLCNNERDRDEPHPKPRRVARVPVQEFSEQVNRRPNDLAIYRLRRRADDDPKEGDDGETQRHSDELGPERRRGLNRARGEVGGVPGYSTTSQRVLTGR